MTFEFKRPIVVDHTKCGTADSTSFPLCISGTYPYLATIANGGQATNANGFDIGFYADPALTIKLPWETELYTAASGKVVYWVQVPTLKTAQDTIIFMAYSNSAISTDQSTPTTAWDSNYKIIEHCNDNAASTTVVNSLGTTNGVTNAVNTSTVSTTSAKINRAFQTNGSMAFRTPISMATASIITIECWTLWPGAFDMTDKCLWGYENGMFAGAGQGGGFFFDFGCAEEAARAQVGIGDGSNQKYGNFQNGAGSQLTQDTFHHLQVTHNQSIPGNTVYVDGVLQTLDETGNTLSSNNAQSPLGFPVGQGVFCFYYGLSLNLTPPSGTRIEQFRLATGITRSASWATASYNNQNAPGLFYTIGDHDSAYDIGGRLQADNGVSVSDIGWGR